MSNIIVENLHFAYPGGGEILQGLNLSFENEPTAIIGQNGAGKTTFVKLLKGLLRPTAGRITVCGKDTQNITVAELAKYIGLVFQNPNDQIFKNKVLDEVMFGPMNIGQNAAEAKENALQALDLVDLRSKVHENPYDLSLSERKLISIASIVDMKNKIIILDEPTIAQDYAGRERIKGIIRQLKQIGTLVLTIIHDMDFVAETFERVIVFQQGQAILDGDARSVYANTDLLQQAYLEQPHVTQLCQKLGCNQIFLTVEEFIAYQKQQSVEK